MSPEERRQLVDAIASLTGLHEGPKAAFPDGTHYEYDSNLKRTVEVAPSGQLFPVTLIAGKLERESKMPVASTPTR